MTTIEQFLGNTSTAVTVNGKRIYVASIGRSRTQFTAKRSVQFTEYNPQSGAFGFRFYTAGQTTPPITNSYTSKSTGKVMIEYDQNGKTYSAELNRDNFDLSPLELLPSVDQVNQQAQQRSDAANEAEMSLFERLMSQLTRNPVIMVAAGVVVVSILNSLSKGKK